MRASSSSTLAATHAHNLFCFLLACIYLKTGALSIWLRYLYVRAARGVSGPVHACLLSEVEIWGSEVEAGRNIELV